MQYILFALFPFTKESHIAQSYTPAFFPTSRTGFLLTYKELAKKAISDRYQIRMATSDASSTTFLHSTVSFINMLLNLNSKYDNKQVKGIIEYMEKEVIHGKLFMHPETMEPLYTPEGTKIQLKMHMTSAIVTELAPLILYFKYHVLLDVVFMEEPEISLHPELQQKITRVLIKLINNCNHQIFISTHSDTIIQHINNMIKLSNNPPDRQKEIFKEFPDNYNESDMIKRENVRMYQFDDDETQRTTISALASSKYGFRAPTFGDFLDTMSNQIDELLEDL